MKTFLAILGCILWFSLAYADDVVDLDTPKAVSPSTVDRLDIKRYEIIMGEPNKLVVVYRWRDEATGWYADQNREQRLYIYNQPDDPLTPEDESTTDFTDIFGYTIQAGDVGKALGPSLKQVILNKMKQVLDFTGDFE